MRRCPVETERLPRDRELDHVPRVGPGVVGEVVAPEVHGLALGGQQLLGDLRLIAGESLGHGSETGLHVGVLVLGRQGLAQGAAQEATIDSVNWMMRMNSDVASGEKPMAMSQALELTTKIMPGIKLEEVDQAFAAQAIACERELGLDHEIVNVDRGDHNATHTEFLAQPRRVQRGRSAEGDQRQLAGVDPTLDGDRALIGADGEEDYRGSAYVFDWSGSWTQTQELMASDGAAEWAQLPRPP